MKKLVKFTLFLVMVGLAGAAAAFYKYMVADYSYNSSGKTIAQVFQGEISIHGDRNDLTTQAGSEVPSVTLKGDSNTIRVETGAKVGSIRGYGSNNVIVLPENLEVDVKYLVGQNNRVQRGLRGSLDGL